MRAQYLLYLSLVLLSSTSLTPIDTTHSAAPSASPTSLSTAEYNTLFIELRKQAVNHADSIILHLQKWAQQVTNDIVKVPDKKLVLKALAKILIFVENLRLITAETRDERALQYFIEVQGVLIDYLQRALDDTLQSIIDFDPSTALEGNVGSDRKSLLELKALLEEHEVALKIFDKQTRILGQTIINRTARGLEYCFKKVRMDTILSHAWPYALLGHWWLLQITPETAEKISPSLAHYKHTINTMMHTMFDRFIGSKNERPEGLDVPDAPSAQGLQAVVAGLLTLNMNAVGTLSIGGIVAPRIEKDAEDVYAFLRFQGRKIYAKLLAKRPPTEPLKNPKSSFSKFIGQEIAKKQIQPAISYLCDADAFLSTGQKIHRGYVVIGPRYSGKRTLADAVAGEVTHALKNNALFYQANDNNDVCKFYELPASEITEESLTKALKNASQATPCVILILHLEDLKVDDQKQMNKITRCIMEHFKNKKESIIMATTSDINAVHPSLMETGLLTGKIYVDYPDYEDRKKFATGKLTDYGLNHQLFSCDALAAATEGQSFKALNVMLEQFFVYAHMTQQPVTPQLFEAMINREIYHVMQHQTLDLEETQVLAAHLAGQVVTHLLKQPSARLTRVTILPVINGDSKKFGQLFTYDPSKLSTFNSADAKKECAIKLAGTIAQEILFGDDRASVFTDDKKQALELAYKIVLQGIDEKLLSKKMLNSLRDEAHALFISLTDEVRELLKTHKDALQRIASALEERQTLTAEEVTSLL